MCEGKKEDPRHVLVKRRTEESYTVSPGDHRDRRGLKTATGRFLSKKNQPRLIDLALNNISTGNPPTPAFLHEPEPEVLCLHQKRQSKTKKKKTTASTNANTGRKNSNSPRGLEKTAITGN